MRIVSIIPGIDTAAPERTETSRGVLGSPPITGPCHYGIDTPTREELIAATHSTEEIRQFLGVDTLGYLSLDGMLQAAGKETGFCHACFSGRYPTPTPDDPMRHRQATPLIATPA